MVKKDFRSFYDNISLKVTKYIFTNFSDLFEYIPNKKYLRELTSSDLNTYQEKKGIIDSTDFLEFKDFVKRYKKSLKDKDFTCEKALIYFALDFNSSDYKTWFDFSRILIKRGVYQIDDLVYLYLNKQLFKNEEEQDKYLTLLENTLSNFLNSYNLDSYYTFVKLDSSYQKTPLSQLKFKLLKNENALFEDLDTATFKLDEIFKLRNFIFYYQANPSVHIIKILNNLDKRKYDILVSKSKIKVCTYHGINEKRYNELEDKALSLIIPLVNNILYNFKSKAQSVQIKTLRGYIEQNTEDSIPLELDLILNKALDKSFLGTRLKTFNTFIFNNIDEKKLLSNIDLFVKKTRLDINKIDKLINSLILNLPILELIDYNILKQYIENSYFKTKFTITKSWLEEHKTKRGGYTSSQLKVLGVNNYYGWQKDVIGREISQQIKKAFEDNKTNYVTKIDYDKSKVIKFLQENKDILIRYQRFLKNEK